MATAQTESLSALYEQDETAWLEIMSELVANRKLAALDHKHLSEYLSDMAKRDRREVTSRLVVLLSHLLKWQFQSEGQSASWRGTMREQRLQLQLLLESATLKKHAESVLADAYGKARKHAADETGVKLSRFPKECAWEIDDLLSDA
jgi:Domain of unknown function DUF29